MYLSQIINKYLVFGNVIVVNSFLVPIITARPANEESPTKKIYKTRNVDIVTLKQWFDTYGKPRAACKPFDFYGILLCLLIYMQYSHKYFCDIFQLFRKMLKELKKK